MDNDVIVDNISNDNITVVIDTEGPNLYPISELIENLLKNYNKISNAADNLIANSAIYLNLYEVQQLSLLQTLTGTWQETSIEMDTLQESLSSKWQETSIEMDTLQESLSSKWQETSIEMGTLQNNLSANWQDTYEKTKSGIIDGGFC